MLTNDQKEVYKNKPINQLLALRKDLINHCKFLSSSYFEDKRKKELKTLYFETIEEIQFINSIIGIDENNTTD
jgi:hypothetical protein